MDALINKFIYIEACHDWLREHGILYEGSYEASRFFYFTKDFAEKAKTNCFFTIENIKPEDYLKELNVLLCMVREKIIENIHNKKQTYPFELIEESLRNYINVVIGQCITIEGYMALLVELRKVGKKLISNGKVEDAYRMAKVNENLNYIEDMIFSMRKGKIKPNVEHILFEIPKATFENFDKLNKRADVCHEWLKNSHSQNEPWWILINSI
jgi:hypothetical protein